LGPENERVISGRQVASNTGRSVSRLPPLPWPPQATATTAAAARCGGGRPPPLLLLCVGKVVVYN